MSSFATLRYERFPFQYPAASEPEWKDKVDRWYQLDAAAFGLAQAGWAWRKQRLTHPPSLILLASPGASNATDRQFALTGATSPARFVHTLPNVRSSSLCQVLDWAGPVLCIQRDPVSRIWALGESVEWLSPQWPEIWVLSMENGPRGHQAQGFFLSMQPAQTTHDFEIRRFDRSTPAVDDSDLIDWLSGPGPAGGTFSLPEGLEIHRRGVT
jgi:hypothetical protein